MPNKKRRERMSKLHRVKLGRYKLVRKDILVIEKMLRIYANAHEKRQSIDSNRSVVVSSRRGVAPRQFADMHVKFGDVRVDSIKFLPKEMRDRYYFSFDVRCDPGVWVMFTPFRTIIGVQVLYTTGPELKIMYEVAKKIEVYLSGRKKFIINVCRL